MNYWENRDNFISNSNMLKTEKPPVVRRLFNVVHEARSMLRTTRILIPSIIISLTILGLAAIYTGSYVDAQAGASNRLRIVGTEGRCE